MNLGNHGSCDLRRSLIMLPRWKSYLVRSEVCPCINDLFIHVYDVSALSDHTICFVARCYTVPFPNRILCLYRNPILGRSDSTDTGKLVGLASTGVKHF